MSKKFKLYHSIFLSIYDKNLYIDVIKNWFGYGFFYILILSAISSVISIYNLNNILSEVTNFYSADSQENISEQSKKIIYLLEQFPTINISNGEATMDSNIEQPFYIKDQNENVIAIIDTKTNLPHIEGVVVITKNKMTFLGETTDLAMFGNKQLTKEFFIDGLEKIKIILTTLFLIITLKMFIVSSLNVLLVCVLCLIINDFILKYKLSFKQIMRACSITLIPALYFKLSFHYISFLPKLIYINAISYLIMFAYMIWILKEYDTDMRKNQKSDIIN